MRYKKATQTLIIVLSVFLLLTLFWNNFTLQLSDDSSLLPDLEYVRLLYEKLHDHSAKDSTLEVPYGHERKIYKIKRSIATFLKDLKLNNNALNEQAELEKWMNLDLRDQLLSMLDEDPSCRADQDMLKDHLDCIDKIIYLRSAWNSIPDYEKFDLDGTDCSAMIYLSEIERYCPQILDRIYTPHLNYNRNLFFSNLAKMQEHFEIYITKNIFTSLYIDFLENLSILESIYRSAPDYLQLEKSRKLLILACLFGEKNKIPNDFMVQLSQVIVASFMLGHRVEFATSLAEFEALLSRERLKNPDNGLSGRFDMILLSKPQYKTLESKLLIDKNIHSYPKCVYRIIHPFGLENTIKDVEMRQIWTLFPQTDDSKFLGVALFLPKKTDRPFPLVEKDKPIALLHSVSDEVPEKSLLWLADYFDIRTVRSDARYAWNLNQLPDYKEIMLNATVLINHGSVIDRVILIEAFQNGLHVIQLNRPEQWGQYPASIRAEVHNVIGENRSFVNKSRQAKSKSNSYLYSALAFLERLHLLLSQEASICSVHSLQTRLTSAVNQVILANDTSCEFGCSNLSNFSSTDVPSWQRHRSLYLKQFYDLTDRLFAPKPTVSLCLQDSFSFYNKQFSIKCPNRSYVNEPDAPFYDTKEQVCTFQANARNFSCSASPTISQHVRLCPCSLALAGQPHFSVF